MHCLADLPQTYFWMQTHNPMADAFNERIQEGLDSKEGSVREESSEIDFDENSKVNKKTIFGSELESGSELENIGKFEKHIPYSYATALFFYSHSSNYSKITWALKYKGMLGVGKYFGSILGSKLKEGWGKDVDLIIPVPLHWKRKWSRGYNQAEIIARAVAEELGIQIDLDILKRTKYTKSQAKLSGEEKVKNVQGAFSVNKKSKILSSDNILHILLVDDVFTSGSTLTACYFALREHFPPQVRISIATLGFVRD